MMCQAVVDSNKRFLDLYIGMLGSINDSHILQRSTLYQRGYTGMLFDDDASVHRFHLYLIGDLGYPLLPWLMIPHKQAPNLTQSQDLCNNQLCKGQCVVENAFGLLKQTFRELLFRSKLAVTFLPDVIFACAVLNNVLLQQSHDNVKRLLEVLREEGLPKKFEDHNGEDAFRNAALVPLWPGEDLPKSNNYRTDLGHFLSKIKRLQNV